MLILQRKKSQSITIGDNIKITILDIGNEQIKIAIDAPREISIARSELIEAANANKAAVLNQSSAATFAESFKKISNKES